MRFEWNYTVDGKAENVEIEYSEMEKRVLGRWATVNVWEGKPEYYVIVNKISADSIEQTWFSISEVQNKKLDNPAINAFVVLAGQEGKVSVSVRGRETATIQVTTEFVKDSSFMDALNEPRESNSHYHAFWER